MSVKALAISDRVATLDEDVVIETLGRHDLNVSATADELGVPSAELRKLLWARPRFVAAADEMVERRLDMGEANIFEAARGANAKLRFLAGCFITRYSTKAWRRGWHTNAPVEKEVTTEPQNITIRWANPDGSLAPPQPTEIIERDGKLIEVPVYDQSPREPVAEPPRIDGPAEALVAPNEIGPDVAVIEPALKPLSSRDRIRVEAALIAQPDDREIILAQVRANGFDTDGL
jgi:hypothetical protein